MLRLSKRLREGLHVGSTFPWYSVLDRSQAYSLNGTRMTHIVEYQWNVVERRIKDGVKPTYCKIILQMSLEKERRLFQKPFTKNTTKINLETIFIMIVCLVRFGRF